MAAAQVPNVHLEAVEEAPNEGSQFKNFCILSTEAPDCGSNHKLQGFLPDDAALHKSLSQMSELLIENRTALATDAPVAVHSEIKWKP